MNFFAVVACSLFGLMLNLGWTSLSFGDSKTLSDLPAELHFYISTFLEDDLISLNRLSEVDRQWNGVLSAQRFQKILAYRKALKKNTVFAGGSEHACSISPEAILYCSGSNEYGQLGIGSTQSQSDWTLVEELLGKQVQAVAAGYSHTVALTHQGEVYTWGRNNYGQLGLKDIEVTNRPTLVTALSGKRIKAIAAGFNHTLALTYSGEVYAWGLNSSDQLGIKDAQSTSEPLFVNGLSGIEIDSIVAGAANTAALSKQGEVYTWGRNNYGQLGIGSHANKSEPVHVQSLEGKGVKAISLKDQHMLALTKEMQVYAWGYNTNCQLGTGDTESKSVPTLVGDLSDKQIQAITVGSSHSFALNSKGEVYGWGLNSSGQLGLGNEDFRQRKPVLLGTLLDKQIHIITSGMNSTFALTLENERYAWGKNNNGELGVPEYKRDISRLPLLIGN
jgi:alpha-tubulin suppressor-like RCC1 family protein